MRVLIAEDDLKMAGLLARGLQEEEHAVDIAATGHDALRMASTASYEAIILDIMLPGIDGFDVCRRLRARRVRTPVLILSARGTVEDRAAGLEAGANDYLTKPFSFLELLERLHTLANAAR